MQHVASISLTFPLDFLLYLNRFPSSLRSCFSFFLYKRNHSNHGLQSRLLTYILNINMSLNRTLEIFFCCAFPLLFIPGYLYTHAFSWQNGFYGMVKDVVVAGHFPASSTTQRHASNITTELHMSLKGQALQSGFTGLKLLDDPLRFLVVALSSVYDGGMPALSLFGMHYIISFAGVCIIVHLEAMRLGNKAVALLRM